MRIPLTEFEQIIDETILKRGLSYFEKGHVTNFVELSSGEYQATVLGSEQYTSSITVLNNEIVAHECDCPYDQGPVCKHIVALIFHLQQDNLQLNEQSLIPLPLVKKKKKKSVPQQLNELLTKVSPEDLKEFIQVQSKADRQFRNLFLSYFANLNESQSKEFYLNQIQAVVNSETDRHGFIGWGEMKQLERGIDPIITIAEKHVENENYENAIFIYTALMEVMIKTYEYCDDSNGTVGGILDGSHEALASIALKPVSKTIRKDLFNYCMSAFEMKYFEDWDWHLGLLHIANTLVTHEKEADSIIKCLDTVNGNYEKEQAQLFKLEMLTKYKTQEEVQKFIDINIANPRIRTQEIEKAIKDEAFKKAIVLCKDGIAYDKQDKPGIVKQWYDWLLEIALIQKDTSKIIEYARYRLIDNFGASKDYYAILKQNVEPTKWKDFLEAIITEITPKEKWTYKALIRTIYINEKWWARLFVLVKQNTSLENIENNEKYLSKDYSKELVQLYSDRLIKYVDRFMGRNHYQKACRYLRRMKKLGGNKEVEFLITQFKANYSKRKALLDELSRV